MSAQVIEVGPHRLCAADFRVGVGAVLAGKRPDAVYCDPPWGPGPLSLFNRLGVKCGAGVDRNREWRAFISDLSRALAEAAPRSAWLEMGRLYVDDALAALKLAGLKVSRVGQVKYGAAWSFVIYCGPDDLDPGPLPDGLSQSRLALHALSRLPRGSTVLDPCCGLGATARACLKLGLRFRGVELNPARLSRTVQLLKGGTG